MVTLCRKLTANRLGSNVMFQSLKSLRSTFEIQEIRVLVSAVPAISCVILCSLLSFSGLQFPNLEHEGLEYIFSEVSSCLAFCGWKIQFSEKKQVDEGDIRAFNRCL